MFIGRFEQYAIHRSYTTDHVLIDRCPWKYGLAPAIAATGLAVFATSVLVPLLWDVGLGSSVGPGLGLTLVGLSLVLRTLGPRWTITHDDITHSNLWLRPAHTVDLADLTELVVHHVPASGVANPGEQVLPYSVTIRMKADDESTLGRFEFVDRQTFEEFLLTLHAVLPLPVDDPDGLFPMVEEPTVEALV